MLFAFVVGLNQFAEAADPAAIQGKGDDKDPKLSVPVTLQQSEGTKTGAGDAIQVTRVTP